MSAVAVPTAGAQPIAHSSVSGSRVSSRWEALAPIAIAAAVICLVLIPYLIGALHGPAGFTFRGALWPIDDESEYLSAIRQGLQGYWLWRNQFMAHPPAPVLIYPTYLAIGHLGSVVRLTLPTTFALCQVLGAIALVGALWALAALYCSPRERLWVVAFAFGTSGLYWLDALLAAAGHAPVSLSALNSPQLSGLTMTLYDGHRALAVAGQLAAVTGLLGAARASNPARRSWYLVYGACGLFLLALTLSMVVSLMVCVLLLPTAWHAFHTLRRGTLSPEPGARGLVNAALIIIPSVPLILYYYWLFSHGAWSVGSFKQIYPPPAWEPVFTIGALLPLAWWGWRTAPPSTRPLATMLALWCCCAVVGRNLPFWQSIRMTDGISIPIGALFALGILGQDMTQRRRLRWLLFISMGALTHYLFLLTVLVHGSAPALYSAPRQSLALRWLSTHCTAHDVVLSSYTFGNLVPAVTACAAVIGHPQMTLDMATRAPQVRAFFAPDTRPSVREGILRETGATLVVYDPQDPQDGAFDPRNVPGLRTVFDAQGLTIFRVHLSASHR